MPNGVAMRPLVWFRADLRVHDNHALYQASRAADQGVIAVFNLCPNQWLEHDWGSMKVKLVLRNLAALSEVLYKLKIPLRLIRTETFADTPTALLRFAQRYRCDALYFNKEYEVNETRRDQAVTALFEQDGRDVFSFADQTVIEPGKVTKADGSYYTVFTPFKRKWYEVFDRGGESAVVLPGPKIQPELAADPGTVPATLAGYGKTDREDLWPAGERHARRRLRRFLEQSIADYRQARDFPAKNATSSLSPYLASGVISPRYCLQQALEARRGAGPARRESVMTWINELIWREFYRHILVAFPRVSMNKPFLAAGEHIKWRNDKDEFEAWCEGRTGVPLVDAGMRQLRQTGWMHNRVRMIVAMFLTKDLLIDWRWGERHFMRHLVDGDLASNNGGWQWSASTGTDAAPYFRIFNPYTQSRRFDPHGEYIRRFVPELAHMKNNVIHEPHSDPTLVGIAYPQPIVDHASARKLALQRYSVLRSTSP
jgi:deoxyribodipyrimidine photo-lyase